MNRREVIQSLRVEKADLEGRLQAVDLALAAFGVGATRGFTTPTAKRKRRPPSVTEDRNAILRFFARTNDWHTAQAIAEAAGGIPVGTAHGRLKDLVEEGRLEVRKEARSFLYRVKVESGERRIKPGDGEIR